MPCPSCFIPGKETQYPFYKRLGGPQGWSGGVRKILRPPAFDFWTVQPVASCYTDYRIPAHMKYIQLFLNMYKLLLGWVCFNPYAPELNPICKSQVPDLFCGAFKFSACFSKNLNISRTERDKFVKQKAVCGEWIRHCSECLKNAVISLLRNVEDTFLKKTCKYTCSFTYTVVQASTLCMEDGRKDVL